MMEPMYYGSPNILAIVIIAVAAVFALLGLAIIHHITRNPDEGPDHWRSHRR